MQSPFFEPCLNILTYGTVWIVHSIEYHIRIACDILLPANVLTLNGDSFYTFLECTFSPWWRVIITHWYHLDNARTSFCVSIYHVLWHLDVFIRKIVARHSNDCKSMAVLGVKIALFAREKSVGVRLLRPRFSRWFWIHYQSLRWGKLHNSKCRYRRLLAIEWCQPQHSRIRIVKFMIGIPTPSHTVKISTRKNSSATDRKTFFKSW